MLSSRDGRREGRRSNPLTATAGIDALEPRQLLAAGAVVRPTGIEHSPVHGTLTAPAVIATRAHRSSASARASTQATNGNDLATLSLKPLDLNLLGLEVKTS